jgi:hypothetical protein
MDKPLYLYVNYDRTQCSADAADNTEHVIANIKHLIDNYNITGFILLNLDLVSINLFRK